LRATPVVQARLHPFHSAVVAIAQPLFQPFAQLRIIGGRRNTASRKAKPRGLGFQAFLQKS